MWRSHDSVSTVVGREKRGTSASIHAICFLGGAMPVLFFVPCLKGRMAHNSSFGVLEEENTRIFQRCSPGNVPQGRRLFLCYFCDAAPLPKALEWIPVPSEQQIA